MKTEVAKIWVDALRSGKYKQGQNNLKSEDKFCCLGVLCDISGIIKESNLIADTGTCIIHKDENGYLASCLPSDIQEWSGIRDNIGKFSDFEDSLALENDNGKTFLEIADIIEENYEIL